MRFSITIMCISVVMIIYCILALIKNEVTFQWRKKIAEAIFRYHKDIIDKAYTESLKKEVPTEIVIKFDVEIMDMEDYDDTFFRWYDWGYKNILPRDKLEIIKPYLKKRKQK